MTDATQADTTTVDTSAAETTAAPTAETTAAPSAETTTVEATAAPAAETSKGDDDEDAKIAPAVPIKGVGEEDAAVEETAPTEDWATIRERIAAGDEKLSKRLARYSSVDSAIEALIAAQNKIASGTLKTALPKDATAEQLAAWREENGIPATAEEYDLEMPDGLVIGEDDQPIVEDFTKVAHELNMTPAQVSKSVAWYLAEQERQAEELAVSDLNVKEEGEKVLKEVWGEEAKLNKNLIMGLLATAPEEASQQLLGGRLADGTPLASNPAVLRWLADLARTVNPVATVVPSSGGTAAAAIETEIASIEKMMGDPKSEYWKNDKIAARYRQLVDVRARSA